MNYKFFPLFFVFLLMSFTSLPSKSNSKKISTETETTTVLENVSIYNQLDANSFVLPSFDCFNLALDGFYLLKDKGLVQKNILTLVDFSLSSNKKRLWVIDLDKKIILFQTLVAHGRNTGEEFAKQFSNQAESFQSSVGFYATGEIYDGKHGMSLKLDGLEKGLNDKARERAVVVHGADYVSESFIKQNKRLGRSQGCPALPVEMNAKIINVIKDKSCLFIYHPSVANEIMSRLAS
ncbi:murein L,D-transpeptidase catalytic domain family protein [Flavobacterium sp. AS60]|uniref:murein L,D-transpeptidase catalytic domain family protein n=1 Tax=Flavobacterium anseongense TaxID=2910677 RepID=UPI001F48C539|nr:murein L,D-transpeptidase catalytic domain family protein [Flavobacterium sp. AS60]MCF6128350.1 murein L,D-transpeptidase catalytic domain family protein [Flavobacterium sp. AS60]